MARLLIFDLVRETERWDANSRASLSVCFYPATRLPECIVPTEGERPPRKVGEVINHFGEISVFEPITSPPGGWEFLVAVSFDPEGSMGVAYIHYDRVNRELDRIELAKALAVRG